MNPFAAELETNSPTELATDVTTPPTGAVSDRFPIALLALSTLDCADWSEESALWISLSRESSLACSDCRTLMSEFCAFTNDAPTITSDTLCSGVDSAPKDRNWLPDHVLGPVAG